MAYAPPHPIPARPDDGPTGDEPGRWTSLNIGLHWLILGLIVVQAIDHEWMVALFDASREHAAAGTVTTAMGYLHIVTGALVFFAVALRLWDRFAHGRPPYPDDEPGWAKRVARGTHAALYGILLAMPVAGLAAWLTGSEAIAEAHTVLWPVLLGLVALHLAGTLADRYWFRTRIDVLARMLPGRGRRA